MATEPTEASKRAERQIAEVSRKGGALVAFVASGTRCSGDLQIDVGAAHIDGEIGGSVSAKNAFISLGKEGVILGDLVAERIDAKGMIYGKVFVSTSARIDGFVYGDIVASKCVVLHAGARVFGDIYCRLISVHAGAIINGRLWQRGECPFVHAAFAAQAQPSPAVTACEAKSGPAASAVPKPTAVVRSLLKNAR